MDSIVGCETLQTVLITGCTAGGIGAALAAAFHDRGCTVYATARRPETMASLPETVHKLKLDVSDIASIKAAVEQVVKEQGRIDVLVNNAGLARMGPVAEMDMAAVREVYDANVIGLLAVTQAVVPHMAARRQGKIVNVGSIAGAFAIPFGGVYSSSKFAVRCLTDALRLELAPWNIQVLLLLPGVIHSNIWDGFQQGLDATRYKLYASFGRTFEKRAQDGSMQHKTPTDTFAKDVVNQVLKPHAPRQYWIGRNAPTAWVLSLLPAWMRDRILAYRYYLDHPAPSTPGVDAQ